MCNRCINYTVFETQLKRYTVFVKLIHLLYNENTLCKNKVFSEGCVGVSLNRICLELDQNRCTYPSIASNSYNKKKGNAEALKRA